MDSKIVNTMRNLINIVIIGLLLYACTGCITVPSKDESPAFESTFLNIWGETNNEYIYYIKEAPE